MKYLLLTKILFLSLFSFNAMGQYILDTSATTVVRVENNALDENNNQYITYSSGFSNAINSALHVSSVTSTNDTVYLPLKVEGVVPSNTEDTEFDTLKVNIAIRAYGVVSKPELATTDADFKYFNKYDSYEYSDFTKTGGGVSLYQTFRFVENQTDTLKVVLTAGQLSFDRFEINYLTQEVVTNSSHELFSINGARVTNPVTDGILTIDLPLEINSAELALFNLKGEIVHEKKITSTENQLFVSELETGIYVLVDKNSGSTKKIVIQ